MRGLSGALRQARLLGATSATTAKAVSRIGGSSAPHAAGQARSVSDGSSGRGRGRGRDRVGGVRSGSSPEGYRAPRGRGVGGFKLYVDRHRRTLAKGAASNGESRALPRSPSSRKKKSTEQRRRSAGYGDEGEGEDDRTSDGRRRGGFRGGGRAGSWENSDDDDEEFDERWSGRRGRGANLDLDLSDTGMGYSSLRGGTHAQRGQFDDAPVEFQSWEEELDAAYSRAQAKDDPDWDPLTDKVYHAVGYYYHKNPTVRISTSGPRGKYEPASRRARSLEDLLAERELPEGLAVKHGDSEFEEVLRMWTALSQNGSMTGAMRRNQIHQIASFIAKNRDSKALKLAMTVPPPRERRKKSAKSAGKRK